MDPEYTLSVQDTNQQALASKISAIRRGYFNDPYAQQFAQFKGNRDILMHRGYWARVHLVRRIIEQFINGSGQMPIQIVSLGCGLETLWFNLMDDQKYAERDIKFIEIDLLSVVKKKAKKIEKSKTITNLINKIGLSDCKQSSEDLSYLAYGNKYHLISCDLSNLNEFKAVLETVKIDYSKPTVFYSECVLSYIQPQPIDQLLKFICNSFRLNWVFDYQMFNPNDRFGKMMVKNFEERGCPLVGMHAYPELQDQRSRFSKAGYQTNNIQLDSMDKIYYNYIDKNERMKIEKIQMLDQLQEWNIIMGHYFGVLAHNCKSSSGQQTQQKLISMLKMKNQ